MVNIIYQNFGFLIQFQFLNNISIFRQNFKFLIKISIVDQNFHFWPKFPFLTNISIFDQNFYFWPKILFLTKNSIFVKKFDFWNFHFLNKNLDYQNLTKKKMIPFDPNLEFWVKNFEQKFWAKFFFSPSFSKNIRIFFSLLNLITPKKIFWV